MFQSTPPKGSDPICHFLSRTFRCFNPRPQKGATQSEFSAFPGEKVSIHAPKRERLCPFLSVVQLIDVSIHAPKRERREKKEILQGLLQFQSTPPKGSDDPGYCRPPSTRGFNPRPQKGATPGRKKAQQSNTVSIHAPKRERRFVVASPDFHW